MTTTITVAEIADYIGFETEPTDWLTIAQEQINQFADCTLDQQFIHTDPVKAKETMFGSTIAHGFLSVSLLSHFAEQYSIVIEGCFMGINYGFDKLRFLTPVKVNSRIRARAKYLKIEETKPGQYQFNVAVTIEIEGSDRPALACEWLSLQMVQ